MEAPPTIEPNEFQFKLDNINCFKHPKNKIVGICNDKNCKNKDKFMCVDCIFESHSGHKAIKSGVIEDLYRQNLNNNSDQNKSSNDEYTKFERNLRRKTDEIKNKINEGLEKLYNEILEDFKQTKNIKINNSEYMDIVKNNYPPKNKEELNKLIEALIRLYNNKNNENNENKTNNTSNTNTPSDRSNTNNTNCQEDKFLLGNKINYYDKMLKEKKENLENIVSEFKKYKLEKFEWTTKTYGNRDFFYKLEENNSKATKISGEGIFSICRSDKPLKKGNKYKLDYYIDYNVGDFHVGFGDDSAGEMDWLKGDNLYSITSEGIFINGKKNENYLIKKENKKVTFIIDLKNNVSEIYIDDRKLFYFEMKPNNIYYPMIAIKELNNSVKLNITEIF